MAIDRRANGHWRARIRTPSGSTRSKTFKRKIDAERWQTEQVRERDRGNWVDPSRANVKLEEWARQWIGTKRQAKPKTIAGWESLLRSCVPNTLRLRPIGKITRSDIETWIDELQARGLSASRIRQAHQLVSVALKAAVKDRRLGMNPAEGVEVPKEQKREMLFLDADEVAALADAAGQHKALILVLAYTGLRWAEAIGLRAGRVDLLHRRIEITESLSEIAGRFERVGTKTDRHRTVVLPRSVARELEPFVAGKPADGLVFTDSLGGPIRHSNFSRRAWRAATAKAGVPSGLRIHDLRHTAAALMIAQGAHPRMIQDNLGHSSITVAMDRYGHIYPDAKEALADRLDQVLSRASRVQNVSNITRIP